MNKKMKINRETLYIIIMPIIMIGLLGPLEIYNGNYEDFSFSLINVLAVMIITSIVMFILLACFIYFLPEKMRKITLSIVFNLSVAAYIQYLFLNSVLARDDGNYMHWENYSKLIITNAVIWIAILLILVAIELFFSKKWGVIRKYIALFCVSIQFLAICSVIITAPLGENSECRFDLTDSFTLGADNNVIVIMVDTYGNELLDMTIKEYPDLLDEMKDFTYYDNADCVYYRTYPSMTHMLTGQEFNFNSEVRTEYCDMAWSADKTAEVYGKIHDMGYSMNIYADNEGSLYFGHLRNMVGKVDNVKYSEGKMIYKRILYHFGRESIYIFAPYIIKPYFEDLAYNFKDIVDYGEYYSDYVNDLYKELKDNRLIVSENDRNRIIYYETYGVHSRYLNDRCEVDVQSTVESTIKGCHVFIDEYLEQLKELGLYDSATIIILGDHGSWDTFIDMDPQPVLFVKRPNEEHDSIITNHAPIDYTQILPTILDSIGVDSSMYGDTIFDISEKKERVRTVYHQNVEYEYYGYTYSGDRSDLLKTILDGYDEIKTYKKKK